MSRLDKEEKTDVVCPTCGKTLKTWGIKYFNHCGSRHSVPENLAEDSEPDETLLTEDELEQGESLVKCSKCGSYLITTEEEMFTHCGKEQSVNNSLADFDEFNGGEKDEEDKEGSTDSKASANKTRTVLPKRKKASKKGKGKKDYKADETRDEEEKPDEGKDNSSTEDEAGSTSEEDGEPDKEAELWTCLDCGCDYNDNGYSDAVCPECGCEYARPYEG